MRGEPSRRRVAMVRCFRVDISRRTRAANFGSAASNSAHDAIAANCKSLGTRTLMAPMASPENAFAASLFEELPARYDRMAEVLSLGQNGKWRRGLVHHIARFQPARILDVATGTAGVAIALAHATEADIVGV